MLTEDQKRTIFEQVIGNNRFLGSEHYQNLLTYLFNASLKNETPKEINIATEVFNRKSDFNPNEDPIVRVYINKLRKKLADYYAKEGRSDKYRIAIPKGHYQLVFNIRKRTLLGQGFKNQPTLQKGLFISNAVLLILVVGLSILVFSIKENKEWGPVWNEFFENDLNTLLVVENPFFFQMDFEGWNRSLIIRHTWINSIRDLQEYLIEQDQTEREYEILKFPYITQNAVWPMPYILSVLQPRSKDIRIKTTNQIVPQDLKQYNIIYLGSLKSLGKLEHFLEGTSFSVDFHPNRFIQKIENEERIFRPDGSFSQYHVDYSLVMKRPGPAHNVIMMFIDFHSTGNTGTAKFFSDREKLDMVEEKFGSAFGHMPPYFEMLLKVEGLERINLSTEISYMNKLEFPQNPE
ncbi:hypothetical protein GF406_11915 [candidate division KSB1 bacterium]|nr:hypothetical protein [candidate division KSB1 bacterium]